MAPLQLTWALIDNGRGASRRKRAPQLCDLGRGGTPERSERRALGFGLLFKDAEGLAGSLATCFYGKRTLVTANVVFLAEERGHGGPKPPHPTHKSPGLVSMVSSRYAAL